MYKVVHALFRKLINIKSVNGKDLSEEELNCYEPNGNLKKIVDPSVNNSKFNSRVNSMNNSANNSNKDSNSQKENNNRNNSSSSNLNQLNQNNTDSMTQRTGSEKTKDGTRDESKEKAAKIVEEKVVIVSTL